MSLWSRFLGFGGLPLLSLVTPLLVLPVLARVAGQDGWALLLVGESVGTLAGIVVNWGWNNAGPPRAAVAGPQELAGLYRESLVARGALALVATPVVVVVCLAFTASSSPSWRVATVLMGLLGMVPGLSFVWYAVGIGRYLPIALYETFPRVGVAVLCAPLVALTGEVWIYPAATIAVVAAGLLLFSRQALRGTPTVAPTAGPTAGPAKAPASPPAPAAPPALPVGWRDAGRLIRRDRAIGVSDIITGGFNTVPIPAVTAFTPTAVASHYASADKLYRLASFVPITLANALQAWTLEGAADGRRRRLRFTSLTYLGVGLLGGVAFAVLGPWASSIIFGTAVAAHWDVTLWLGLAFLALSLKTCLVRHYLLPVGRMREVLTATAWGAGVGLAGAAIALATVGPAGVAAAVATSELVVVALLVAPARSHLSSTLLVGISHPSGSTR